MQVLKITKKVKNSKPTKVYDFGVEGAHHYILKNGVVSHNSYGDPTKVGGGGGSLYASSAIISLTKAQIKGKDGVSGDDAVVGARITAKNIKSRFAKEKMKIKLDLDFGTGLQRYSGLQEVMEVLNMLIPVKRSFAYNPTGVVPKECQGRKQEQKDAFEAWLATLSLYNKNDLHPGNTAVWESILENGLKKKLIDLFSYQGETAMLDLTGDYSSDEDTDEE